MKWNRWTMYLPMTLLILLSFSKTLAAGGRGPTAKITLNDGSEIVGEILQEKFKVAMPFGTMSVATQEILFVDMAAPEVRFRDGSKFKGRLLDEQIQVKARFGELELKATAILSIDFAVTPQAPRPQKEAPRRETPRSESPRVSQAEEGEGFLKRLGCLQNVVSINPVGFVFGVVSLELECVRAPDLGVGPALLYAGGSTYSLIGLGATVKKYVEATAPERWWWGGNLGVVQVSVKTLGLNLRETTTASTSVQLGAWTGYKWLFTNKMTLEPSIGLTYLSGALAGVPISGVGVGAGLQVGYAF